MKLFLLLFPFFLFGQEENTLTINNCSGEELTLKLFGKQEILGLKKRTIIEVFKLPSIKRSTDEWQQYKWGKKRILHLTKASIIKKKKPNNNTEYTINKEILYPAILRIYTNRIKINYQFGENEIYFENLLDKDIVLEISGKILEANKVKEHKETIHLNRNNINYINWGLNKDLNTQLKIEYIKFVEENKEHKIDYTCFGTTQCSITKNSIEFKDSHHDQKISFDYNNL